MSTCIRRPRRYAPNDRFAFTSSVIYSPCGHSSPARRNTVQPQMGRNARKLGPPQHPRPIRQRQPMGNPYPPHHHLGTPKTYRLQRPLGSRHSPTRIRHPLLPRRLPLRNRLDQTRTPPIQTSASRRSAHTRLFHVARNASSHANVAGLQITMVRSMDAQPWHQNRAHSVLVRTRIIPLRLRRNPHQLSCCHLHSWVDARQGGDETLRAGARGNDVHAATVSGVGVRTPTGRILTLRCRVCVFEN